MCMRNWSKCAVLAAALSLAFGETATADLLYDNGPTDGSNAYSNIHPSSGLGVTRRLLDDFVVPVGQMWSVSGFEWTHIWNSGGIGIGTGIDLFFRADAGGSPGIPIGGSVSQTSYSETATGNNFFGRAEVLSVAAFNPVVLGPGVYWFDATIITNSPDNNFWMVHAGINGSVSWVDYSDLGGLQSSFDTFGVTNDLNFQITGVDLAPPAVPEPSSMILLGIGGLGCAAAYRRRKVAA